MRKMTGHFMSDSPSFLAGCWDMSEKCPVIFLNQSVLPRFFFSGFVCRILFLCHGNAVYGGKVIPLGQFSLRNFCHVLPKLGNDGISVLRIVIVSICQMMEVPL